MAHPFGELGAHLVVQGPDRAKKMGTKLVDHLERPTARRRVQRGNGSSACGKIGPAYLLKSVRRLNQEVLSMTRLVVCVEKRPEGALQPFRRNLHQMHSIKDAGWRPRCATRRLSPRR